VVKSFLKMLAANVCVYDVALAKLKIILSAPAPWNIHGVGGSVSFPVLVHFKSRLSFS
jgi:hypothetical protein